MGFLVAKQPRQQTAQTFTIPSPCDGLNTRDPYANMPDSFAVQAINFLATPQGLSVREGSIKTVTGITGYVESLLVYKGLTGSADRIFACAGNKIYDATNATASPTAVVTGTSSAYWEHTNMSGFGGKWLVACNGVDTARYYDGTSWNTFSFNASPSAPGQINTYGTGTPSSTLSSLSNWSKVFTHQQRLWGIIANTTQLFYLPILSLGGTAQIFDVGAFFPRGGYIETAASWSVDLGTGITNYLVIVSTSGDVVIYGGTDPSTASTFQMVGQWSLGEPVGKRCLVQYESDMLYLSQDGLYPMSKYLVSARVDNSQSMSNTIQPSISDLTTTYATLPGFEMINYPGNNLLLLNIPQINADQNFQFAYNTITDGWTQLNGWGAQCWCMLNNNLYFGGNGYVAMAFQGYRDLANADGSGGNSYTASALQAFNYFRSQEAGSGPAQLKEFLMARVNLVTAVATPSVTLGCNVDFNPMPPTSTLNSTVNLQSAWDTAIWDTATWTGGLQNFNEWISVNGIGYAGAIAITISVNDETLWVSTDWLYNPGGVIG